MKIANFNNLKITAKFDGEVVEITKLDLVNKTLNIKKTFLGKNVYLTFNSKNDTLKKLTLDNFTEIEFTEQ